MRKVNSSDRCATVMRGTTIADVANYAGLSAPTIYKAIKNGELRAKKVERRSIVLPQWVDQWLDSMPDTREGLA